MNCPNCEQGGHPDHCTPACRASHPLASSAVRVRCNACELLQDRPAGDGGCVGCGGMTLRFARRRSDQSEQPACCCGWVLPAGWIVRLDAPATIVHVITVCPVCGAQCMPEPHEA